MSAVSEQFIERIKDVGNRLLQPPSSIPELLNLLDEAVLLLSKIGQSPSECVHDALLSTMKALISDKLMGNSDADVMITTAACLHEIMRITAPTAPYDDEKMKEVFELIVLSFDKLSCAPGRCYSKAMLILEKVARLRSCILMLDLDCDSLITKMFELFQKHASFNHPPSVVPSMKKIMSYMIIESDCLPVELIKVLLDSLKKESENNSPSAFKLGVEVVEECSEKLKPYIMEAITAMGCSLDDYAPILSSLCETEPIAVEDLVHESAKQPPLKTLGRCSQNPETDFETASEKGETHYIHDIDGGDENLTATKTKSPGSPHAHIEKKSLTPRSEKADRIMEDEPSEKTVEAAAGLDKKKVHQASSFGGSGDKKRKPTKKDVSGGSRKKSTTGLPRQNKIQTNDAVKSQKKRASSDDDVFETPHGRKNYKEDLVGCKIMVYWPLDRRYYEGNIASFDPSTKKHKVEYDDGDQEVLNLREERWEFVGDEISTDIELFVGKKTNQPRLNMPQQEALTVSEKETPQVNSNKRDAMSDTSNEAGDKSHQAVKIVEKVKLPEFPSETKRPKLSESPNS